MISNKVLFLKTKFCVYNEYLCLKTNIFVSKQNFMLQVIILSSNTKKLCLQIMFLFRYNVLVKTQLKQNFVLKNKVLSLQTKLCLNILCCTNFRVYDEIMCLKTKLYALRQNLLFEDMILSSNTKENAVLENGISCLKTKFYA